MVASSAQVAVEVNEPSQVAAATTRPGPVMQWDETAAALQKSTWRKLQFYLVFLAYYAHIPLIILAIYPWIDPPAWTANLSNDGDSPFVILGCNLSSSTSSAANYIVYQTSPCLQPTLHWTQLGTDEFSTQAISPSDFNSSSSIYWSYLPCLFSTMGEPRNYYGTDPQYAYYGCGLSSLSSAQPVSILARIVLAAVIAKEIIKLIGYGRLHSKFMRLQRKQNVDGGDRQRCESMLANMSWYSRSLLMLPYVLWHGRQEIYLLFELEYRVPRGKEKVYVVDMLLQDVPHIGYTVLIFIIGASWAILNTTQTKLNLASLALSLLFAVMNALDALRAFVWPIVRYGHYSTAAVPKAAACKDADSGNGEFEM